MSQRIATLMIRIKNSNGERRYHRAFIAANGNAKPLFAIIDGKPEFRPEGIYYLRYTELDGTRRYQYIGKDPKLARLMQVQRQHIIEGENMGLPTVEAPKAAKPQRVIPLEIPSVASLVHQDAPPANISSERLALAGTIDSYVREVTVLKHRKRGQDYRFKLGTFLKTFKKTYLDEIRDDDVIAYISSLKDQELSDRSIKNYCTSLRAFLRRYGYSERVKKSFIPKPTQKVVRAYSVEQLKALFAAASREEGILYRFFLGLGMREREVMFAAWSDIDFERGVFHVTEKKDDGFTIKDREERSIPIPSLILESLKQRYDGRAHKRWVFPSDRGQPDGHMLRRLQKLAFRAGLNCGECRTKSGGSCVNKASCKQFGLHKFRRTYATLNHENGTSIRALMDWLGHSDLETTIRYLAGADAGSERVRMQVDKTYEVFA